MSNLRWWNRTYRWWIAGMAGVLVVLLIVEALFWRGRSVLETSVRYGDVATFPAPKGVPCTVRLQSSDTLSYRIVRPDGLPVALPSPFRSRRGQVRFRFTPPVSGVYRLRVTSARPGTLGTVQVTVREDDRRMVWPRLRNGLF